jgi:hypothetical protein
MELAEDSTSWATYEYDPRGRMTKETFSNGVYSQCGYDNASRLTSLNHKKTSDHSLILGYAATYDADTVGATMRAKLNAGILALLLLASLLCIACGTGANAQRSGGEQSAKEEWAVQQRAADASSEARAIAEIIRVSGKYNEKARSFVRRALDGQPNAVRVKTWLVLIRAWEEDAASRPEVEKTLLWMTDTSSSSVQASGHYIGLARLKGELPQAAASVTLSLPVSEGAEPDFQNSEYNAALANLRSANDATRVAMVVQLLSEGGDYYSLRSLIASSLAQIENDSSRRAWTGFAKRCLLRRFPDDRFE